MRIRRHLIVAFTLFALVAASLPAQAAGTVSGVAALITPAPPVPPYWQFTTHTSTMETLDITWPAIACGSGSTSGSGYLNGNPVSFSVDWAPGLLVLGATSGNLTATLVSACPPGGTSATLFGPYA